MHIDSATFERAAEHARSYVTSGVLPSALLAVADRERVLAIRSFGERGEQDPSLQSRIFALASITKAIVGTAIARLVDQGRLDYTDPVVKHIPEFATAPWRERIAVGDIFTHSTGLPQADWAAYSNMELDGAERLRRAFPGEPVYEPGTRMQYATLTYQILNEIVRRLVGRTMSEFLAESLFEPCGMADTGFRPTDPERALPVVDHPMDTPEKMELLARTELSGGGLWSTAGDLVRFGQAVLSPGRLLSAEGYRNILVVIGAGHLKGTSGMLQEALPDPDQTVAELDRLPAASRWPKLIPWAIVALVFLGFVIGFQRSPDLGWQLIGAWVFINGSLSALGAAIATAHPLTVVTAFLAAPITSLNPTIGAGMVTAAVELWIRKPKVRDFETLRSDTTSIRGWWKNRVSKTLLVFLLSTLGSAVGTYVAGFRIIGYLSN